MGAAIRHQHPASLPSLPLAEQAPLASAAACAVLLLSSWLNPGTVWLRAGGSTAIQGWGWQTVATAMGALAIVALGAGLFATRAWGAAPCALAAACCFGIAAGETARTWIDLTKEIADPARFGEAGWTVVPASGMDRATAIALVGAAVALVLAGAWLNRGEPR